MRRLIKIVLFVLVVNEAQAQLPVLRDPAKDSAAMQKLYKDLPVMTDSFFSMFKRKDLAGVKKFVPRVNYLKETFDTMAIEYREEQVIYRQQLLLRTLQKDYKKILKQAEKSKTGIHKLILKSTDYEYGEDEDGNKYCYVTTLCYKRKRIYELRYLAILLNGSWFVGDELSFQRE